jgi:monoamine oxidase
MIYGRTPLFRQVMKLLLQSMPESEGRRRFIKQAAMAGAGMMLPSCATTGNGPKRTIAIVGGGIAGLTAAWRLVNAGHEVHLYEGSARTGGRMFTKRNFNADGQFVELGAELVDTNHTHIIALAKELGVPMQNLRRGKGTRFHLAAGPAAHGPRCSGCFPASGRKNRRRRGWHLRR